MQKLKMHTNVQETEKILTKNKAKHMLLGELPLLRENTATLNGEIARRKSTVETLKPAKCFLQK